MGRKGPKADVVAAELDKLRGKQTDGKINLADAAYIKRALDEGVIKVPTIPDCIRSSEQFNIVSASLDNTWYEYLHRGPFVNIVEARQIGHHICQSCATTSVWGHISMYSGLRCIIQSISQLWLQPLAPYRMRSSIRRASDESWPCIDQWWYYECSKDKSMTVL